MHERARKRQGKLRVLQGATAKMRLPRIAATSMKSMSLTTRRANTLWTLAAVAKN